MDPEQIREAQERLQILKELSEAKRYRLKYGFTALESEDHPGKYECYFNGMTNILTLEEVNLYSKYNVVYIVKVATKGTKKG